MTVKRLSLVALVLLLTVALGAGVAETQQSQGQATVQVTNNCDRGTLSLSQLVLSGPSTKSIQIVIGVALQPGQSKSFDFTINETPTQLLVVGAVDQRSFNSVFSPLTIGKAQTDQANCLQVLVTFGGGTQPPPEGGKNGITPGEGVDQLLLTLQAHGVSVHQQGSQSKPKLGDAHDPMLLNALPPLSAQLIWVSSSSGTLSSVLTWDQPLVDLDLIVIGIGGSFCFALTPPGILAETCDRVPFGPVVSPIGVFAVFIINWSPSTQAFVLSLAG
jgi:hypothetical protein